VYSIIVIPEQSYNAQCDPSLDAVYQWD